LIGACLKSQTKSEEAESRGRCSGTGPPSYQLNRNHGLISCMFFTKISDSLASHVKESFFFFLEAPVLAFLFLPDEFLWHGGILQLLKDDGSV
jgi:hypothetical protein